jgi:hypothetical protein
MGRFITIKRWQLKQGREEADLVNLVKGSIMPHYESLSQAVRLRLWRIEATRSYLALQEWSSRAERETVLRSDAFQEWYRRYEPILARWHELMALEDEWETEELL